MRLFQFVSLVSILIIWRIVCNGNECRTSQFVEIGSVGVIQCSFRYDIFGALWYKLTSFSPGNAFLTLANSEKSGEGFLSGEFDIYQNGSLIIQNVSMKHEGTYKVTILETAASDQITYLVNVFVFAPTFSRVPVIDNCDNKSEVCFQILNSNSNISCTIRDARPEVPLRWMLRTGEGDRNISSRLLTKNETHHFFTSHVTTTNPFVYSRVLTLLVCRAYCPLGLLEKNESLVLIQSSDESLPNVEPNVVYAKQDSRVKLNCSGITIAYLVWQVKEPSRVTFKSLIHAIFVGDNLNHLYDKEYELQNTSIAVDNIRVKHEGTYRCISGNGFQDDVIMYELIVLVYPEPGYPVVDGCNHQQYCVLEVPLEGILTCTLKGIRPQVKLDIRGVFQRSSNALQFYDKIVTIKDHGDTSDVFLTSHYRYKSAKASRLTVECKVVGTNIEELRLSTKFDLLFLHGAESTTDANVSSDGNSYWIITVVLAVVLVFFVICSGSYFIKARGRRGILRRKSYHEHGVILGADLLNGDRTEDRGKMQTMIDPGEVIHMKSKMVPLAKKDLFISELKAKYQDLYDAVQPIPYIRDRLYCVDRVFVEGGIEYLVEKNTIGGQGTWDKLFSYHNIFDDGRVKSTRLIIEGEPGYGKSTLTLQLSYDWCTKIPLSHLKDIEILILLRLRQLGGVTSVYRAIKRFLLPKDSKLTESDIADIISECSSVLVILDGYDEYPEHDVNVDSDINNIIMRNMFQQFEVILTTRSSYLPKKYPAMTKRLKLTGFDDNARDQYIRKAVVGDDVTAAEKIKQRLKENPVLGDLCQVPLFFAMFAHMSQESEQFQRFSSVTSFFRYMISCFHSHMKNKMEDDNVKKYDLFETEHTALDKLAFKGLDRKDQRIVWSKHHMCERLGQDFYDQYVRIGILVEEEVLDISDDPNAIMPEHIQYKTEVRFYHKLFCEWYAAHHLSEYASRNDLTFDPWESKCRNIKSQIDHYLTYVDPFDLQYVYRFTCGLNREAADKIIEYLKTRQNATKFAILCILEKSGKVEDVLKDVKDLCAGTVEIRVGDTLLLQRSIIQLLTIAVTNKISISCVRLYNCYSTVDLRGGNHLQLKSNLPIPVLTTLNKLEIGTYGEGREMTSEEFKGILQYSSKCLALKELVFVYCLLPPSVQDDFVSVLRSRNFKVFWCTRRDYAQYQLNLQSCLWEYENYPGRKMTDEDYQKEVKYIKGMQGDSEEKRGGEERK